MSESVTVVAVDGDPVLSADAARAIVNRIRQCVGIANAEIKRLYAGRAWIALGYGSWEVLCDAEFGDQQQVRLSRPERQNVVTELREAGMSTRAIAGAIGVNQKTVVNDLRSGEENSSPDDDEVVEAEVVETPAPKVTGRDGKRYPSSRSGPAPTRATQLAEMTAAGMTAQEIAEEWGTGPEQVLRVARTNGIAVNGSKRQTLAHERDVQRMRDLAASNHSSRQIAKELERTEDQIGEWRIRYGIAVPADAFMSGKRRLDSNRVVEGTVAAITGIDLLFDQIDYPGLDRSQLAGWVSSLDVAIRSLTTMRNNLKKELAQ